MKITWEGKLTSLGSNTFHLIRIIETEIITPIRPEIGIILKSLLTKFLSGKVEPRTIIINSRIISQTSPKTGAP